MQKKRLIFNRARHSISPKTKPRAKLALPSKKLFIGLLGLSLLLIGAAALLSRQEDPQLSAAKNSMPIWNGSFSGKTVVIDPGHGGIDPGAIGVTKVKEKDVNLPVALKVKDLLIQAGVNVIMIREEDRDFGSSSGASSRKREDLAHRTKVVDDANADIILSIHCNSYPNKNTRGAQVFYYKGSPLGPEAAEAIQDRLNQVTGRKRVVRPDNFYMLRNTQGVALTVEIGFLSNPEEEKKLVDSDYQNQIAMAIALGVADYFEK
ncbi:MAG: N-acetylmuramoyl-L-alanine amidase [Peptococcaceae bacterium]|nr:N-acetylmuramoyl-L-alanine amidase [Peptococcaceae bacterium]